MENISTLQSLTREFAKESIAPAQLFKATEFPHALWKHMGQSGILGIGIPIGFGGQGGTYLDVAQCGKELVASGHCLGFSVSWMIHIAAARFLILGMGTGAQKTDILPRMANGEITMSLSISEPETGAHPKHMKTQATPVGKGYKITGQKAYLTNGPIADLYAVISITSEKNGKKQFTAFLVTRETKGLEVESGMDLGFFRPSPHGGITLNKCKVQGDAVLGPFDGAYEAIVKAFRDTEDILMMGPVCGGLARLGQLVAERLAQENQVPDETLQHLGLYLSLEKALYIMALEGATRLDSNEGDPELGRIPVAFRHTAKEAIQAANATLEGLEVPDDSELAILLNDLVLSGRIAHNVSRIKQTMMGRQAVEDARL